ncbi:MAG TPA: hypothetical protein VIY86_05540 [Pirellulaceae bacterium]
MASPHGTFVHRCVCPIIISFLLMLVITVQSTSAAAIPVQPRSDLRVLSASHQAVAVIPGTLRRNCRIYHVSPRLERPLLWLCRRPGLPVGTGSI